LFISGSLPRETENVPKEIAVGNDTQFVTSPPLQLLLITRLFSALLEKVNFFQLLEGKLLLAMKLRENTA
jgi:hypothetical protein